MTTCPHCDTIKIEERPSYFLDPTEKVYCLKCDCGFAKYYFPYCRNKKDMKKRWERFVKEYERRESVS